MAGDSAYQTIGPSYCFLFFRLCFPCLTRFFGFPSHSQVSVRPCDPYPSLPSWKDDSHFILSLRAFEKRTLRGVCYLPATAPSLSYFLGSPRDNKKREPSGTGRRTRAKKTQPNPMEHETKLCLANAGVVALVECMPQPLTGSHSGRPLSTPTRRFQPVLLAKWTRTERLRILQPPVGVMVDSGQGRFGHTH